VPHFNSEIAVLRHNSKDKYVVRLQHVIPPRTYTWNEQTFREIQPYMEEL